jgi:uncharacterized protein YxjI
MDIEDPEGGRMARAHKALITPPWERWKVDVGSGPDMEIHGNAVDHEHQTGHQWEELRTPCAVSGKNELAIDTAYGDRGSIG